MPQRLTKHALRTSGYAQLFKFWRGNCSHCSFVGQRILTDDPDGCPCASVPVGSSPLPAPAAFIFSHSQTVRIWRVLSTTNDVGIVTQTGVVLPCSPSPHGQSWTAVSHHQDRPTPQTTSTPPFKRAEGGGLQFGFCGARHMPAGKLPTRSPWEGRKGAVLVRPLWPRGRWMRAGFGGSWRGR